MSSSTSRNKDNPTITLSDLSITRISQTLCIIKESTEQNVQSITFQNNEEKNVKKLEKIS